MIEHRVTDEASGLDAWVVLDGDGVCAGGVRTMAYPSAQAALEDARKLTAAMTIKCRLGGLPTRGGKCVVRADLLRDRTAAFESLGEFVQQLDGKLHTAGDLGTTAADLESMSRHSSYVHAEEDLGRAVGRGLLRCVEAAVRVQGGTLPGLRVGIQGCGAIGEAVALALHDAGADLIVADIDPQRAQSLAELLGTEVVGADEILFADVDVLSPCAIGGVIGVDTVERLKAWALCGAANNVLASDDADHALLDRGILHVPDVVASAGAVIEGVGRSLMGLDDRRPLIDALGGTAEAILRHSRRHDIPSGVLARTWPDA